MDRRGDVFARMDHPNADLLNMYLITAPKQLQVTFYIYLFFKTVPTEK